ncbi:MAG: hypothetical protein OEX12_13420 [Gammaproteobacteria bacterium]|nr:hypothetical protein [Gammaproteobacteria bacterium]
MQTKASNQLAAAVDTVASSTPGQCIGCDKELAGDGLCEACEGKLDILGRALDENGLTFSSVTVEEKSNG